MMQSAPQDFSVDLRVDIQGCRNVDSPMGRHPATILVRDGIVDISDIDALVKSGRVPMDKEYKPTILAVMELQNYTFRDFLVALHNLSLQYRKYLAGVLYQQATRFEMSKPLPSLERHMVCWFARCSQGPLGTSAASPQSWFSTRGFRFPTFPEAPETRPQYNMPCSLLRVCLRQGGRLCTPDVANGFFAHIQLPWVCFYCLIRRCCSSKNTQLVRLCSTCGLVFHWVVFGSRDVSGLYNYWILGKVVMGRFGLRCFAWPTVDRCQ